MFFNPLPVTFRLGSRSGVLRLLPLVGKTLCLCFNAPKDFEQPLPHASDGTSVEVELPALQVFDDQDVG